ncbi:MAG: helix-turn-helix transcriptional regulator [Oribacterium sp.]|nr:helix-turn-helix transcriptional regulator [Oribacterium sp.]
MYYADQLIFVAGILFNAFFWRRLGKDELKSIYLKVSAVLFYLGSFIIILYPSSFAFLVLAPIVYFFLGILGGSVHYFVSAALLETGLVGRTIATGAVAVYILQYFVQILADNNLLLLLLIITGGITLIPIVKNSWQWIILECLPEDYTVSGEAFSRKKNLLGTAVILSIVAVVLFSYFDSWLIRKMVDTDFQAVSAYAWPRLFVIPGYVLAGLIGDYKEGRFLNITLFTAVLWLMLCPVLLADNASLMLIMVIFYITLGVYMGYMYFKFFTLAPYFGKNGILYASAGKIIECTAGVVFSLLPWNEMKTWHIIAIGIMSVTIMAAAIVRSFIISKESERKADASVVSDADSISAYSESESDTDKIITRPEVGSEMIRDTLENEASVKDISEVSDAKVLCASAIEDDTGLNLLRQSEDISTDTESFNQVLARISKEYEFTSREQEVFEKLIFTEDSGQDIADALFISRRVLQRHVAAIYEKTGTKSRVGLFRIYHKASMGE